MFKILALVLCLFNIAYAQSGSTWALLVAGSNGYDNYRHQADICHAYQILHAHGIPDDHIVVMMYDDIANNVDNKDKGKIINRPGGPDVYHGVLKDYTKKTVTPKNFLNILQGNQAELQGVGSGKVINSGPNDNVFVFFSDHGAPGIVAFPDGSALHASDLNKAIKNMHAQNKYKNLVVYIEACESGSMFDGLLANNTNVYATTASNPDESSYACYWDDKLQTYLGDVYSVMWMEDSDKEDLTKETLLKQFQLVRKETNTSHVMQYGDLALAPAHFLSEFQGNQTQAFDNYQSDIEAILRDTVPTEKVKISILQRKLDKETDSDKRAKLLTELEAVLKSYRVATVLMKEIPSIVYHNNGLQVHKILNSREKLTNHECYVPSVDYLSQKCFDLRNEIVLRHLYIIVNLCEHGVSTERIQAAVDIVCKYSQDIE